MHPHLHQLAAAAQRDDMLRRAAQHRLKAGAPKARRRTWNGRLLRWRKPRRTVEPVLDVTTPGPLTGAAVSPEGALMPRPMRP
jgi:hypothetical protein